MRIKFQNEKTSGNRKGWAKVVTGVDTSKTNGYALDGDFLPDDTEVELPVGSIIVECRPEGSVKNGWKTGYIYRVNENGIEEIDGGYDWRKDFLSFRDKIQELLGGVTNPLAEFSDDKLIAELKNRGYKIS